MVGPTQPRATRLAPPAHVAGVFPGLFVPGLQLLSLARINHRYPLLWRFHNVHHLDPDLDITTSFRFQWGEVLYSTLFRVLQVLVSGVSWLTYVVYEICFQLATMFHHSNLRLPLGWERILNQVFVTPRMHGVHHSIISRETYSNFSVIFRWWDQVHGSLRLNIPQAEITIGVPAYQQPGDNWVANLLLLPFIRQRTYWRTMDGSRPDRPPDRIYSDPHLLAE